MFERFTDRARSVVVLAQEEARLLDHNYIGTEHLLLGLIREGKGVAAIALERLGISLVDARERVQAIIGRGGLAPSGHVPFTPRAKNVLELSLREALQLGHNYIGTEHVLLGLIREGEGVASHVLARMGADHSQVRREVIQVLSGTTEPPTPRPGLSPGTDTPATARAMDEARRLAGDDPVGTHDVLRAIVGDTNSLGAKALAALGVTAETLEPQLATLGRAGTSDERPEEAGARQTRVEVLDDGVAVVLRDNALRDRLAKALNREPLVIGSGEPVAATFPVLWAQVHGHLTSIAGRLERDAIDRWRPPEFDDGGDVAAYAVIQRPGGAVSYIESAEGVNRDEIRAALGEWLIAHQPKNPSGATYLAVLVDGGAAGDRTYRLSWGALADWPRTQLQFLVAHAIVDLTGATPGAVPGG